MPARTGICDAQARDPDPDETAIQTVGEKGWDGFAMAVVVARSGTP